MALFFGKRNMGTVDRFIRTITGLALMYVGFFEQEIIGNQTINIILGVFGIISILFAYIAFCPIYTFGNISTIKNESEKS